MSANWPAARVVCVDADGRVLLLHWHDTVDDVRFWEPPGGRLEPGERPLDAARRELYEETGLSGSAILTRPVDVARAFRWLGTDYERVEPFYLAPFRVSRPLVRPTAFTPEEDDTYLGHAWLFPPEVAALADPLTPPNLIEILEQFRA